MLEYKVCRSGDTSVTCLLMYDEISFGGPYYYGTREHLFPQFLLVFLIPSLESRNIAFTPTHPMICLTVSVSYITHKTPSFPPPEPFILSPLPISDVNPPNPLQHQRGESQYPRTPLIRTRSTNGGGPSTTSS